MELLGRLWDDNRALQIDGQRACSGTAPFGSQPGGERFQ
jgi:hypothetical protein